MTNLDRFAQIQQLAKRAATKTRRIWYVYRARAGLVGAVQCGGWLTSSIAPDTWPVIEVRP